MLILRCSGAMGKNSAVGTLRVNISCAHIVFLKSVKPKVKRQLILMTSKPT